MRAIAFSRQVLRHSAGACNFLELQYQLRKVLRGFGARIRIPKYSPITDISNSFIAKSIGHSIRRP